VWKAPAYIDPEVKGQVAWLSSGLPAWLCRSIRLHGFLVRCRITTDLGGVLLTVEQRERFLACLSADLVDDLLETRALGGDGDRGLDLGGGDRSVQLGHRLPLHLVHRLLCTSKRHSHRLITHPRGRTGRVKLKFHGSRFLASLASSSDTSDTPDFLVTCQRHPREDVMKMLRGCYEETVPVEFQL